MNSGQSNARDDAAVRRAVDGFADAWNRHDMEAFEALFAPDSEFVNVTGQWWKGHEEIRRNHAFVHGSVERDTASVTLPAHVYGIFKNSTHTRSALKHQGLLPPRHFGLRSTHGSAICWRDERGIDMRSDARTVVVDARPEPLQITLAQSAIVVADMQKDFGAQGEMFDRAGIDITPIERVVEPTAQVRDPHESQASGSG